MNTCTSCSSTNTATSMTSTIVMGTIHRHRGVSLIRTDTFTSACSTAIRITPISTTDMVIRR